MLSLLQYFYDMFILFASPPWRDLLRKNSKRCQFPCCLYHFHISYVLWHRQLQNQETECPVQVFKKRSLTLLPEKHPSLLNAHSRFEELNSAYVEVRYKYKYKIKKISVHSRFEELNSAYVQLLKSHSIPNVMCQILKELNTTYVDTLCHKCSKSLKSILGLHKFFNSDKILLCRSFVLKLTLHKFCLTRPLRRFFVLWQPMVIQQHVICCLGRFCIKFFLLAIWLHKVFRFKSRCF